MAAYAVGFMTHVTCTLTAKYRDQLRNPTFGNRVRATFLASLPFLPIPLTLLSFFATYVPYPFTYVSSFSFVSYSLSSASLS